VKSFNTAKFGSCGGPRLHLSESPTGWFVTSDLVNDRHQDTKRESRGRWDGLCGALLIHLVGVTYIVAQMEGTTVVAQQLPSR